MSYHEIPQNWRVGYRSRTFVVNHPSRGLLVLSIKSSWQRVCSNSIGTLYFDSSVSVWVVQAYGGACQPRSSLAHSIKFLALDLTPRRTVWH